ncbi:MAG: bacteriohemerythrin [Spirochaetaceae bacterium]|jgi:hemerythrin|nr:bacteriohemerythrin [Spirochaetaceae bacterium]
MIEEFIAWKDIYSVGIVKIDDQHKELINLTRLLYDACLTGTESGRFYFKKAVHDLVNYVAFHFSAEEKLMERMGFPGLPEHKKEHEKFVKKVLEDVKKFESGKAIVPNTFVRYLREWILTHIAKTDQEYGLYARMHFKQAAEEMVD